MKLMIIALHENGIVETLERNKQFGVSRWVIQFVPETQGLNQTSTHRTEPTMGFLSFHARADPRTRPSKYRGRAPLSPPPFSNGDPFALIHPHVS